MSEFDPEQAIAISADSVAKLRKCDVFRVLDWAPVEHRGALVAYIAANRPDLADEAREVLADLVSEA